MPTFPYLLWIVVIVMKQETKVKLTGTNLSLSQKPLQNNTNVHFSLVFLCSFFVLWCQRSAIYWQEVITLTEQNINAFTVTSQNTTVCSTLMFSNYVCIFHNFFFCLWDLDLEPGIFTFLFKRNTPANLIGK